MSNFDYCQPATASLDHLYNNNNMSSTTATTTSSSDDETMNNCSDGVKRGPWTVEEDIALANYISVHGEGRWNSLARCAGLNRTGKSCRLRWLNYLRPDVRRGNITPEEQLLILELHSRWGNRWSKIAQYLPGRTDNEIKNYWRTRVQKHAKQLKCDVNSQQFKDTMRYLWMPRLVEKIQAQAANSAASENTTTATAAPAPPPTNTNHLGNTSKTQPQQYGQQYQPAAPPLVSSITPSSCNNNYYSDNNSSTSDSTTHQIVHSPASTGGCAAGDYYPAVNANDGSCAGEYYPAAAEQGVLDHNMNQVGGYAAMDSLISPSANYYLSQYLASDQPQMGLDFPWLDVGEDDHHQITTTNDVVDLWTTVDSYDHLFQQQQQFSTCYNQITSAGSTYF